MQPGATVMDPQRGFPAEAASSGVVLGQAIELLTVGLEPEEEPPAVPVRGPQLFREVFAVKMAI
jgi:hypothetical protein